MDMRDTIQILLIWELAGAAIYTVTGGNLVAHNGRILAIANRTGDAANTHFRRPLEAAGITVLDYPASDEDARAMLGLEALPAQPQPYEQLTMPI